MGMFSPVCEGSWSLYSESDKRWRCHGRAMVGGFMMPKECEEKIEELKKKYGEPPADLQFSYMKD